MARYAGQLLGPMEGFGPEFFNAVLVHVRPFLVFSSNFSYFNK